jgi:hypothetical protein
MYVWKTEWAHHIEKRCVSEEGSRPVDPPVDVTVGFEVCGCGCSDTDDRLHDGTKI